MSERRVYLVLEWSSIRAKGNHVDHGRTSKLTDLNLSHVHVNVDWNTTESCNFKGNIYYYHASHVVYRQSSFGHFVQSSYWSLMLWTKTRIWRQIKQRDHIIGSSSLDHDYRGSSYSIIHSHVMIPWSFAPCWIIMPVKRDNEDHVDMIVSHEDWRCTQEETKKYTPIKKYLVVVCTRK